MRKRISAAVLLLAMLFSVSAAAISPRWDSGARCTARVSFSGNSATCTLKVTTASSSDKITATITLTKDGRELASWVNYTGTGELEFSKSITNANVTSGTYRMSYHVVITGSGGTDTIDDYVEAKK